VSSKDDWGPLALLAFIAWATGPDTTKGALKEWPTFKLAELRGIAERAGFPDPDLAAAVAMAESGGKSDAVNSTPRELSVGLWQINLKAHPKYDLKILKIARRNAQAAFEISKGGTDWTPWSTFTSGAYKRYLPGA